MWGDVSLGLGCELTCVLGGRTVVVGDGGECGFAFFWEAVIAGWVDGGSGICLRRCGVVWCGTLRCGAFRWGASVTDDQCEMVGWLVG